VGVVNTVLRAASETWHRYKQKQENPKICPKNDGQGGRGRERWNRRRKQTRSMKCKWSRQWKKRLRKRREMAPSEEDDEKYEKAASKKKKGENSGEDG
jgi:hypothetical protein